MTWLTVAGAWLRERAVWVAAGLAALVAILAALLRREHLARVAAEGRARFEAAAAASAERRRVRVAAARARREVERAQSMVERYRAQERARVRRDAIVKASGDELGALFDKTFDPGRRR